MTRTWFPLIAALLAAAMVFSWLDRPSRAVPERPSPVVMVYRHDLNRTEPMDVEEYVKGVVAAEMPASFHIEALKAQAVAARTLAVRLMRTAEADDGEHDAVISTDPSTHQAWMSKEQLEARWGSLYLANWAKITRATAATRGMVVVYDYEPIFAAYHASSGGQTEDSEKYWIGHLPYLRSVADPYVAGSRYEETEARVSLAQLASAAGGALPASAGSPVVEVLSRYPSGRVETVRVGDEQWSGREMRERLGLRSNWFDIDAYDGEIVFRVRGYGHGVGMSQYGADGMGRAGLTFDRILLHYYTGVEVVSWYE